MVGEYDTVRYCRIVQRGSEGPGADKVLVAGWQAGVLPLARTNMGAAQQLLRLSGVGTGDQIRLHPFRLLSEGQWQGGTPIRIQSTRSIVS